jgi:CHAT domain-containing protein/Tfp pilus assembly protein PilF
VGLHARNLCVLGRALILTLAGVLAGASPSGLGAQPASPALQAGTAIERRLAGGESHSFSMEAVPGGRLLITVEQRGIDVVVEVLRPGGQILTAVDSPTDSEGPESILLPLEASGSFEIRVRSPNPGVAPGAYTLVLEELGTATPVERERIEAERLTTEAAAHNREGTAESRRLGADRFQEAMVRWRTLGRRREEARCALAAGGSYTALGEPKPALALYRQALALFEELADEAGQAAAWSGIGLDQTALGDTAAAADGQRRALSLQRGLGNRYEEGKALNNLGFALHSQGELREALSAYQQALEIFHRVGEQGLWEAAVLQNLAMVSMGLGEPEIALTSHRRVLEKQRALGDRKAEARTLNNIGVLYYSLGELGEALETYAAALAIVRLSGDRLQEASLLYNIGVAHYGLGDFQRALANLEQSLSIRHEIGDKPGEAGSETAIGEAYFHLGDNARALDAGRRAVGVASAVSDRRREMLARLLLGEVSLAAGEPTATLSELTRALEISRLLVDRSAEPTILRSLGEAYLALKQPETAAELLTQAVDRARAAKAPARVITALTSLARADCILGRPQEALSRASEAISLIETLRATEPNPDLRASFLAARHNAFEIAIDLQMELDRREPGKEHARTALEISEHARARSLLDLLQEAGTDVREGVDPALRDRERALLRRLKAKVSRQDSLLKGSAAAKREQAADQEVGAVLAELAQIEAEIRRHSPRYAALTQPPAATSNEIQHLLDGKTLLLEYALGEERSFLWAVDREAVIGFELPSRARIEEATREVYGRLSVLAPGEDGESRLEQASASLSRMLLGPVAGRLADRRLVIVADGELQYIPFGVLPLPGGGGAPLITRHEILNAPSATALILQRRLARREPATGMVAVLADPVFDAADPRVAARSRTGDRELSPARFSPSPEPLLRLPWTRREAQAIAAAVPPGRSLLALDFRASRKTALSRELSRYRILHFATHGLIDAQTPALSGLMLSRVEERGAPVEGFLGLDDIYNLRLGANLVVLSGCETALGKNVRGEGLVGLTQGFLYAGARQVLSSLWRVEDQATAELMSHFYRALLSPGRTPAAALRLAQLAVRNDKRWRSPYYWSGFVLQGDGEPAFPEPVK